MLHHSTCNSSYVHFSSQQLDDLVNNKILNCILSTFASIQHRTLHSFPYKSVMNVARN